MAQGIGTFAGLTVLGVDFPHSRGVSPSAGLLRLVPLPELDRVVSDLVLSFDGNSTTFSNAAVATCNLEIFEGRDGFRWNVVIQDGRWRWRYPRITGTYNRRLCDGTVEPKGKKNARELAELIATELGDTIDVTALPTSVYPPVVWNDALARYELAWLCDLFALDVAPRRNGSYVLEPITATVSLPTGGRNITPPHFSNKPGIMPSDVIVEGGITKKQGWVQLQSIWLDRNGKYDVRDNMSYTPGTGWGTQWPNIYPDVPSGFERTHAFDTGYRLYAPVDPTIILDDHVLEVGLDIPADQKRCLPAIVRGKFNSHDDFATTTHGFGSYSGDFKFRKDINALEFAYPVYKIVGGSIEPAELEINTGYYQIDADLNPIGGYEKTKAVPQAVVTTKPRILRHHELGVREIVKALYGGTVGSNTATLDAEAQSYLDAVVACYAYDKAQDVLYDGLVFDDIPGISQRKWLCGNGRIATTRIGVNTEIDITAASNQQRRALERLAQMAERASL